MFPSLLSVREQGQDRDSDGVCEQGRAVRLHQRAAAPERAGDATLLQTDSLRRAPLPQGEKTHPVTLFSVLCCMFIVTPTVHFHNRLVICRPYTRCFSWPWCTRVICFGMKKEYRPLKFRHTLRLQGAKQTLHHSVLICWHSNGCPEIPPETFPQRSPPPRALATHH